MARSPREQLEALLEREVDRRFELEIVDRLRSKRLAPLARKPEVKADEVVDEGMSDEDLSLLQALDQGGDDDNAVA